MIAIRNDAMTDYNVTHQLNLPACLAVVGDGILKNNVLLPIALRCRLQRWYPWHMINPKPQGFIGWGRKKSFQRASTIANLMQMPVYSIEDGFLRSLDGGVSSRYGASFVVDDVGIYFDLTQSSRLEKLIVQRLHQFDKKHQQYAKQLIRTVCSYQLSKYNHTLSCPNLDTLVNVQHSAGTVRHILLIDQVQGDASVTGASADANNFAKMLTTAIQRHSNAHIWIKAHPAGRGYFANQNLPKQVRLITDTVNPIALLEQVSDVYTVSSHMGFEALMLGKTVHCHGMAWYAGWGLTDDSHINQVVLAEVTQRRQKIWTALYTPNLYHQSVSVEQLFYAAYVDYSVYADPASFQACGIEEVMAWLITNRQWQFKWQRISPQKTTKNVLVYHVSRWKKPFIQDFFCSTQVQLMWHDRPKFSMLQIPLIHQSITNIIKKLINFLSSKHIDALVVWGMEKRLQVANIKQNIKPKDGHQQLTIYCMEDGFIRSNGLGATLLAPLSVVVDGQGIYYNATTTSDLEELLINCNPLTPHQTARVQILWQTLLEQKVSKYNVGQSLGSKHTWVQQLKQSKQKKLLIVGQVEDDLSIKYCGSVITTNQDLIARVRQDNPQAYLLYKPHPDVEMGLRMGKVHQVVLSLVDAVATDVSINDCLMWVDEVHTISSQTGFEALLRGKTVVCYGLPFYAGWGLTVDKDINQSPKCAYLARRQKKRDKACNNTILTMEQLLYMVLIDYPLYRLPNGYGLAQVEQVIAYLYAHNADALHKTGISTTTHKSCNAMRSVTTQLMILRQRLR